MLTWLLISNRHWEYSIGYTSSRLVLLSKVSNMRAQSACQPLQDKDGNAHEHHSIQPDRLLRREISHGSVLGPFYLTFHYDWDGLPAVPALNSRLHIASSLARCSFETRCGHASQDRRFQKIVGTVWIVLNPSYLWLLRRIQFCSINQKIWSTALRST